MKRKIQAALAAIDIVFSDTSVSQQATLEALDELRVDIEFKMEAIRSDLRHQPVQPRRAKEGRTPER